MKLYQIIIALFISLVIIGCGFIKVLRKDPYNVNKNQAQIINAIKNLNYDSAMAYLSMNKTRLMPGSELLKKIELGRLLFLSGRYDESTKLFIEAEYKIEDTRNYNYVDAFGGTAEIYNPLHPSYIGPWVNDLANYGPRPLNSRDSLMLGMAGMPNYPLHYDYQPNNIEKPLVNIYNGLGSIHLKEDLLIVEAKRLGLLADRIDVQKASINLNLPYIPNPFIRLMQGLFFEAGGSLNDALISYENVYKEFENPKLTEHYGIRLPEQLKTDIISINSIMGFKDKEEVWRKKLKETGKTERYTPCLIIILEEGTIRHKLFNPTLPKLDTVRINTTTSPSVNIAVRPGGVAIGGTTGGYQNPANNYKVRYPLYMADYVICKRLITKPIISFVCNQKQYPVNRILDLNYLMENTFGKRYYYEIMGRGSGANADYRQWLSLPSSISYIKIPMVPGQKNYAIKIVSNGKITEQQIEVENPRSSTIRHLYLPSY